VHLADGQLRLLCRSRPIDQVLADPATRDDVRDGLTLVAPVLDFAREIGLDVGRQYRAYAEWPGDRVVTALVATRPGEIEAATSWFPLVGHVPYRGFFELERAEREAARLAGRGLDTCLVPVPAYSTLGWLPDPVPEPLVARGRGFLVETLIHELVHATLFVPDDADFNEGLASFVGQEGAVRFFADRDGEAAAAEQRRRVEDERAIAREIARLRERVAALYREPDTPERAARRAALGDETRAALAALPLATLPADTIARMTPLQDACLALAATYDADLDAYARRLEALGGDLAAFFAEARQAARTDDPRAALGAAGR
jgi:predicted aminopeptidase